MRIACTLAVLVAVLAAAASAGRAGREPQPRVAQTFPLPGVSDSVTAVDPSVVRRQVENLVRGGRIDEAISMLERRRSGPGLDDSLARRLARLYRDVGRHADLERFLVERADGDLENADVGQLRMIAEARFAQGNESGARQALELLVARDPTDASLLRLVANVYMQNDHTDDAVKVLEEGRRRLDEPYEFAQFLGRLYGDQGRVVDATREYCRVIVQSPLNVSLMRGQVLELAEADPEQLPAMLSVARGVADDHSEIGQVALVVAELELRVGDGDAAWSTVVPLLDRPELLQELLRMSLAGLADSRLPDIDARIALDRLQLSARVTRGLLANAELPSSLEPRVYDTLTRTLLGMLENEAFEGLPESDQLAVLEEARVSILDMNQRFAGNSLTAAAMLRLAGVYVDALHRPEEAIDLYRGLSLSPNAPREQVQLARIGLGRSYIAAGDTATARSLFYDIGQDMDVVEGQGRAQFHLGMIDFMGGHFTTAADRFKAVALEAPRAEYTNDALDLALILAEEEFNGSPDERGLLRYGRALFHRATFQTDSLRADLENVGAGTPGLLRDRARLDLSRLHADQGQPAVALALLDRLVLDAPESRYTPSALDLQGQILEGENRPTDALAVYEKILLEHEEYVLMDRVRDRIRVLRGGGEPDAEEDLP